MQEETVYGPDYALIGLDRKVADRQPLAVNRRGGLKKGARLFVTGHPNGLPFKFTANGRVVADPPEDSAYFKTDLDTFSGNSGSPVFNADTLLIEGVHVRGDSENFIPTFEGCGVYAVRPQNAGYPGSATKIDYLLDSIPPTPLESAAGNKVRAGLKALRAEESPARKAVRFDF
jgi:hypothetical protein